MISQVQQFVPSKELLQDMSPTSFFSVSDALTRVPLSVYANVRQV